MRVERISTGDLDHPLLDLGAFRLVRMEDVLSLEIPEETLPRALAMLARAGARTAASPSGHPGTDGLIAAIAAHLAPMHVPGVVDVVSVRALEAGEATARLTRSAPFRRRSDHEAIRAILHGSDRAFTWTRVVHAPRALIRSLPGVRPVVFDREAIAHATERIAFADGAPLTRWAA